ncbi:unnamed protein product [Toxocara canis]|uniref:DUF3800 domain-containing protein n=1 Tax=Toxocara canis TaxID=6265 RepID=A0A183U782_TOXCA|nr:unnamed protein product [Toxocara canis]
MFLYVDAAQPTISSPSAILVPVCFPQNESDDERIKRKHQMHTPPQALFDRIATCFEHAVVDTFRIRDFRITDECVEKLTDVFKNRSIQCGALKMKFCKLSYVSPEKFSTFIQLFNTDSVSMAWIRGNNGHISMPAIMKTMCDDCRAIDICSVTPAVLVHDNQFFRSFLRNSHSHKILRLDNCSVNNAALLDAIQVKDFLIQRHFRKYHIQHKSQANNR